AYRDYMQKVRQRIYSNWRLPNDEPYPREISARLVIEFLIGKDGQLLKAEIVQPSGEHLLDISAMRAVKLADRYPPLPDAMQRDVLSVVAIFSLNARTGQSSTFQLLQSMLLTNARIHTMDPRGSIVDSLVIREGRVAYAGARGEINPAAGERTLDLLGRAVLPGLVDGHGHLMLLARARLELDLSAA